MSVTVSQHKNFVGGEWVDAVERRDDGGAEPGDRRDDRRGARAGRRRTSTAPSRRRRRRCRSGSRRRRASAPRCCSSSPTRSTSNAEELAELESRNVGKPLVVRARRDAGLRRQPPLLRRRGAHARGQVGRRVHARLHVDDPARAARDRRRDRAVELPADDGGLEDRPGARGRQRPGPEAVRADAADDAALRRARAGHRSRRAC